jgi:hypothetical protein
MATDPRCFSPRAIVWAEVKGNKETKTRICVVLRREDDRIEVAYGQGEPESPRDFVVKPGTPNAKRFQVTKDTYFRPGNIAFVPHDLVKSYIGQCSNADLLRLEEFAQAAHLTDAPTIRSKPSTTSAPVSEPIPQPLVGRTPTPRQVQQMAAPIIESDKQS